MNIRTTYILLALVLTVAMSAQALAEPQFLTAFQQLYTDGSCGTCHVNPAGGGTRNSYGMMFENQSNFDTNTTSALMTIGPAPGSSSLTPTINTTPTIALVNATPIKIKASPPTIAMKSMVKTFENMFVSFMNKSLPPSLNKFFKTQKPEVPGSSEWVKEMFIQRDALEGIATNLQEGDVPNAIMAYNTFADEYTKIYMKVPRWKGYFDINTLKKLGTDLKAKKINASLKDLAKIGETCSNCHEDHQPQVWAKYYWRDFDTVNVSTAQGEMVWGDAMFAIAGSLQGIGTNAAEGKQDKAKEDFNQFKALYKDLKTACDGCHDTPRFYYVSDDVFAKIDMMGENIDAGNLNNTQKIKQELDIECYKCHVLHMPAQDLKAKVEN